MLPEIQERENTAYHELGHALTAALLGFDSYVEVIPRVVNGMPKAGLTITPGIYLRPPCEFLLKVLGGGLGEALHVWGGTPPTKSGLLGWMRHESRFRTGTQSDWEHARSQVGSRLDDYIAYAAEFALERLYKQPTIDLFPIFSRRLIKMGSARVTSGDPIRMVKARPLEDEFQSQAFGWFPSRFKSWVSIETWKELQISGAAERD